MVDGANPTAAATTVSVTAEDLHMSAVPKRVVQLSEIIAVRLLLRTQRVLCSHSCRYTLRFASDNTGHRVGACCS